MAAEARLGRLAAVLCPAAAGALAVTRCLAAAAESEDDPTPGEGQQASALPASKSDFFLSDDLTYLNTGTLGPLPRAVVDAVNEELTYLAANPLENYFGGGSEAPGTERMDAVRSQVAAFLGCEQTELALVPSTTVAFNVVGGGLVDSGFLRPEHTVLQTDQEHPVSPTRALCHSMPNHSDPLTARAAWPLPLAAPCSVRLTSARRPQGGEACWRHMEALGQIAGIDRVELGACPASADEIVAGFSAAITASTRVVCVSHVM